MAYNFSEAKSKINLVEILLQDGFFLDVEESSKESFSSALASDRRSYAWILRRGGPDGSRKSAEKVGVSLLFDPKSHAQRWLYTDNRQPKKHGSGSIIDWVLSHVDGLKTAGEALRYVNQRFQEGKGSDPASAFTPTKRTTAKKTGAIQKHIEENTWPTATNKYLIEQRLIPREVLDDPRFSGTVREDRRGNAIFVHQDRTGITGYSVKNHEYSIFSSGGERSLWRSNCFKTDTKLVITESAIDALSYFLLKKMEHREITHTRFLSIDGRINEQQLELILSAIAKIQETVLAFDDDETGSEYVEKVYAACSSELFTRISREIPPYGCKDWNEVFSG